MFCLKITDGWPQVMSSKFLHRVSWSVAIPMSVCQPYQSFNLQCLYPRKRNLFSDFPAYKFYVYLPIVIASGISIHFTPNKNRKVGSNWVNALFVRRVYINQKLFVCGEGIREHFIACSSNFVSWSGGLVYCSYWYCIVFIDGTYFHNWNRGGV